MSTIAPTIAEQLTELPDTARVWIYQANRPLLDDEVKEIEALSHTFLKDWNAHGSKMTAKMVVLYNRFVVLAADESAVQASGCSIDSSVRFVKSLEEKFNVSLFERTNLAYRDVDGEIQTMEIPEFQNAIGSGALTKETIVFNNLVDNVGALKSAWEVPALRSWHIRLFEG